VCVCGLWKGGRGPHGSKPLSTLGILVVRGCAGYKKGVPFPVVWAGPVALLLYYYYYYYY